VTETSPPSDRTGSFEYADLFAGIGGFAAALRALGGKHAYAVEIDAEAAAVYEHNWAHPALGDITEVANDDGVLVPAMDVLAGGFPCQAFSKSGAQRGMDEARGTLIWNVLKVVEKHRPTVVVLENVRNLIGPRHRHEYDVIIETLRDELGYRVTDEPAIISPHRLPGWLGGRPQVRERVFITATYNPKGLVRPAGLRPVFTNDEVVEGWNPRKPGSEWNLFDYLEDSHEIPGTALTKPERLWIDAWNEFVEVMYERRDGEHLPGFPFWADSWRDYAQPIPPGTPAWKRSHLEKNYRFYAQHRAWIDGWAERWGIFTSAFPPSRRKLEWQAQDAPRLWDTVMQLRPSGIRAKRPTHLPALVAITQTSIVGPRERRLSVLEAARLQGLPDGFSFATNKKDAASFKQLGNGVSTGVVWNVFKRHVERDRDILETTTEGRMILEAVKNAPASPDEVLAGMFPRV
jgi:DNA (cytosine-5)-methyltransferase 1